MLGWVVSITVLCQVFTLTTAEHSPASSTEFDDYRVQEKLGRDTRDAEPSQDSCACAKTATIIDLKEKWGNAKLDRLLKLITRLVDSVRKKELETPVVVIPVLIDESFRLALDEPPGSTATTSPPPVAGDRAVTEYTLGPTTATSLVPGDRALIDGTSPPTDTTPANTTVPKDPQVVCALPQVRGRCKAIHRVWSYNAATDDCAMFIYGGCGGNDNRFNTKDACLAFCKGVATTTTTVDAAAAATTPDPISTTAAPP